MQIIPAILEKEWLEIEKKLKLVDGLTEWIQLDVSDGIFTPVKTWANPSDLLGLNLKSKLEVHLMVKNPIEILEAWLVGSIDRIIVHAECLRNVQHEVLNKEKEIVLGFNMETPWAPYADMIQSAGRVLFLSVNAGYQGQEFNESVLEKIKTLKQVMPNVNIEVDGGISLENINKLKELGVDAAVIGSAIFESADPKQTIAYLTNI